MYIQVNNKKYPCQCWPGKTMIYSGLPEDFPYPVEGTVVLCDDDDNIMREDNPADFLRQTFVGGTLTLTNTPEPEPAEPEPEPVEPVPSPQEDQDAMLVDHEYRITLLELGVNI